MALRRHRSTTLPTAGGPHPHRAPGDLPLQPVGHVDRHRQRRHRRRAAPATDGEPPMTDNGTNRPPITVSDADPIFLDGPVGDVNPGVNEIAIPSRPANAPLVLSASYRSTVAGVRSCLVPACRRADGVDQEPRQRPVDHVRHQSTHSVRDRRRRAPHRHVLAARRPDRRPDHRRADPVTQLRRTSS